MIIEISVGVLPKWYIDDEGNCDYHLEDELESKYKGEFGDDADIHVSYNYQTEQAIIKCFNDDGDLIKERLDSYDDALQTVRSKVR